MANGWLDWTRHVAGVQDKTYSQANSGEGIVGHSVEGDDRIDDIPDRFLSTEKDAQGRYTSYAASSCMFINPREDDHDLVQMYPTWSSTWTSGNRRANCSLWACESEGYAGQPLTPKQVENLLRLSRDWEDVHPGQKMTRGEHGARTFWQHNEVWNWDPQNAGPTACPSGRYDGFFAELEARAWEKDDSMTEDELLAVWSGAEEVSLSREERLVNARFRRDESAAGRAPSVAEMAASAKVAAQQALDQGAAGLSEHKHIPGGVA